MFNRFTLNYCHYDLFPIFPFIFPTNPSSGLFFFLSLPMLCCLYHFDAVVLADEVKFNTSFAQFVSAHVLSLLLCGRAPDLFPLINTKTSARGQKS